jgi:FdhD protein
MMYRSPELVRVLRAVPPTSWGVQHPDHAKSQRANLLNPMRTGDLNSRTPRTLTLNLLTSMTDELTLKASGSLLPWKITEIRGESGKQVLTSVVIEEPLEVHINDQPVAVLMRTPGAEKELAVGFCLSEGLIADLADIALVHHCGRALPTMMEDSDTDLEESRNMVRITLASPSASRDPRLDVVRLVRSGCGRTEAEELASQLTPLDNDLRIQRKILLKLTSTIKQGQDAYREAGGIHAAGVFTSHGELVTIREDIGRHNAVDKALGHCLMQGIPLKDKILVSTGRASYEMVTKTVRLGLPVAVSLSSPTSLAVELADYLNCTLVGYLRGQRMRIYTHTWRLER